MRIGPAGRFSRASSHHGHVYQPGGHGLRGYELSRSSDGTWSLRQRRELRDGWGPETGTLYVSGGSHAGRARYARIAGYCVTGQLGNSLEWKDPAQRGPSLPRTVTGSGGFAVNASGSRGVSEQPTLCVTAC